MVGNIFNIQHFSHEDGPGIRTTVFLKGCNLHCPWCHNPESQSFHTEIMYFKQKCIGCQKCSAVCPQNGRTLLEKTEVKTDKTWKNGFHLVYSKDCLHCGQCAEVCPAQALVAYGKMKNLEEIVEELIQDKDLYDMSGGGVTISGGEPLMQVDFLEELLKALKKQEIHTAIETAGCYDFRYLERILPYIDYIFMDLKCLDEEKHRKVIGASNKLILDNLKKLSGCHKEIVVRIPVIMGFNDEEQPQMAAFINTLPKHVKAELLPYHEMCSGKYDALNREFCVQDFRVPTKQEMDAYKQLYAERILL